MRTLERLHLVAQEGAHRARVLLVDEGPGGARVQGDGRSAGELVVRGHDGVHCAGDLAEDADSAAERGLEGEAEVRAALDDGLGGGVRIARDHPDLHRRVDGDELRQRFGKEVNREAVEGQNGHRAADDPVALVDLPLQPGEVPERGAEVVEDQVPRVGEAHPVRAPFEERGSEVALELEDLPVDGRGGDAQPLRSPPDRALLGDRLEVAEDGGVHRARRRLSPPRPRSPSPRPPDGPSRCEIRG